jgi:hypothetical protein
LHCVLTFSFWVGQHIVSNAPHGAYPTSGCRLPHPAIRLDARRAPGAWLAPEEYSVHSLAGAALAAVRSTSHSPLWIPSVWRLLGTRLRVVLSAHHKEQKSRTEKALTWGEGLVCIWIFI